MPILVDTSVWIDLLLDRSTPQVTLLSQVVGRDELLLGDLILAELLQGIRHERDVERVEAAFADYSVVPLVGEEIARLSAANDRQLRRQGIIVRKTVDCLIASWCIRHGVPLLHSDGDFAPFARLGLKEVRQERRSEG